EATGSNPPRVSGTRMTRKLLSSLLLACASLSACAQTTQPPAGDAGKDAGPATAAAAPRAAQPAPGAPAARALEALRSLDESIVPEKIEPAPLTGFQQAIVGGQVIYVSDDGRYLLQGSLYDIA